MLVGLLKKAQCARNPDNGILDCLHRGRGGGEMAVSEDIGEKVRKGKEK